ncbi:NAD-dependent epimerase/dehydratase family protein, partial [Escherichia coli]|nr:NAD-dependent epimerase/dehydratase family protein [Escherichia coli]EJV4907639.1 NAD-dependent epimerase/dehydratase family protein [Escherichia coli]
MKILVTGAAGFIGRNLVFRLKEAGYNELIAIDRNSSLTDLEQGLKQADFIFHLAGVNRPVKESEFEEGNCDLTQQIVDI